MRIKQMILHRDLSEMKNKILPTCLQGNYGDSSRARGVFGVRGLILFERHKVSLRRHAPNLHGFVQEQYPVSEEFFIFSPHVPI